MEDSALPHATLCSKLPIEKNNKTVSYVCNGLLLLHDQYGVQNADGSIHKEEVVTLVVTMWVIFKLSLSTKLRILFFLEINLNYFKMRRLKNSDFTSSQHMCEKI